MPMRPVFGLIAGECRRIKRQDGGAPIRKAPPPASRKRL